MPVWLCGRKRRQKEDQCHSVALHPIAAVRWRLWQRPLPEVY
jgi:hypothetical protein